MSENVQFDSDQQGMPSPSARYESRVILGQAQVPGMSKWLMNHGVGSEGGARYVLLFIILISIVLSGIVLYFSFYAPQVSTNLSQVRGERLLSSGLSPQ